VALRRIEEYPTKPPVLRALKAGKGFKLYLSTQEKVIEATLTKEDGMKKFSVAYISRQLLDVETRYSFLEKLCLSLYYACAKFRPYILLSTYTIVSNHDVVKHMLNKPVLSLERSGRQMGILISRI
jgi:hypothetical protein